ncbi:MAG: Rid family detoxifying hydrolase [Cardiobacteriaceae bacterium]|nr:Rid family detoxifying hydrolase [Cardiobacteriaceae bacterium]
MSKEIINAPKAPKAIGAYSHAAAVGNLVFLSGQIPLNPETMELEEGFTNQANRVFSNLQAVCEAAGTHLNNAVKLNIYLMDLANFAELNEIMAKWIDAPYPARAAIQVAGLPKGALIEIEAVVSR